MSLSNNIEIKNPATKFFEWSGQHGHLKYFDKTKGEKKDDGSHKGENVIIMLPFTFITLDTLSTIKGYSDADQSGYWANEVRDTKKEILIVRSKKGECAKGLYADIISKREITGAKYSQSVYMAYKENGVLVIANVQMTGAALSAWIDFLKKNDIYKGAVSITSHTEAKKGATVYKIPNFKLIPISEETKNQAIELDKQLQEYLAKYFNKTKTEQVEVPTDAPIALTPEQEAELFYSGGEARNTGSFTDEIFGKKEGAASNANDDLPF